VQGPPPWTWRRWAAAIVLILGCVLLSVFPTWLDVLMAQVVLDEAANTQAHMPECTHACNNTSLHAVRNAPLQTSRAETPQRCTIALNQGPLSCNAKLVFDAGLPRTGTTSVHLYMKQLGYRSIHILHGSLHEVKRCRDKALCDGVYGNGPQGAFSHIPTFGLACQLSRAYPEAVFVLTSRGFEGYFTSVRYMLCRWVSKQCVAFWQQKTSKHDLFEIACETVLYGDAFSSFCNQMRSPGARRTLCGDDFGAHEADAWVGLGLKQAWRKVQRLHDAEVRSCVNAARLLEVKLESNDTEKACSLHRFLQCSGAPPPFAHGSKAKQPA